MKKLFPKKVIFAYCAILLLVCIITSVIGGILVSKWIKRNESENKYNSELQQIINLGNEAQSLSIEQEISSDVENTDFEQTTNDLGEYIKKIHEMSITARSILDNEEYQKYKFAEPIKSDLEVVAQYDEKITNDLGEFIKAINYLGGYIKAFEDINTFKASEDATSTEYAKLIPIIQGSIKDLEMLTYPDSLKGLHESTIRDMQAILDWYSELVAILQQLEVMQANPSNYTVADVDALEVKLTALGTPPVLTMEKAFSDLETSGIISDENVNKLDSMETEFVDHYNKIVDYWNEEVATK